MAENTSTSPAPAPKAKAKGSKNEGVTLHHADGREKTVTDPGVVVDLEFSGWSRDKSVFKKSK